MAFVWQEKKFVAQMKATRKKNAKGTFDKVLVLSEMPKSGSFRFITGRNLYFVPGIY